MSNHAAGRRCSASVRLGFSWPTPFFESTYYYHGLLGLVAALGGVCCVQAQGRGPKFIVDPIWPQPLPHNWVNGQVSGVCVDKQDHVFIVNRNDMTDKEAEIAQQAPPFIEFDPDGNVVNSFGDWKVVPNTTHACVIDYENNVQFLWQVRQLDAHSA